MAIADRYKNPFFFLLLGFAAVLLFLMYLPFLSAILTAMAFSVILKPLYCQLLKFFRGHRGIASACTILFTGIVILIPISLIGVQIYREAQTALTSVSVGDYGSIQSIEEIFEEPVQKFIPAFDIDIVQWAKDALNELAKNAGSIFASTVSTVLNFFILILALYFLLMEGDRLRDSLFRLSPLPNNYDELISHRMSSTITSVLRGSLLVALIQGTLAGIGFWIFGVPNPTLWGALTAISALVPTLGTGLTIAPAIVYLFATGHVPAAIGLTIYGVSIVGLVDNILGPTLISMGKGVNIHPFLILISVLGGISLFNVWGLVLGPLFLSLFLALLDVYTFCILNPRCKIPQPYKQEMREASKQRQSTSAITRS